VERNLQRPVVFEEKKRMTQRLAFAVAAGLAAFVAMLLVALVTYVALRGPATIAAQEPNAPGITTTQGQVNQAPASGGLDSSSAFPVSADQAINIALNTAPGASLMQQPRLVNLSGSVAYEVPLDMGMVYIDATNGQVLYNAATQPRRRLRR